MTLPAFTASDLALIIVATAQSVGYVIGVVKGTVTPKVPELAQQALATANEAKRTADETKQRLDAAMKPKPVPDSTPKP